MSGQSVMDRMQAARHSVLGSQIGKKVCKATTEEVIGPKRKHLDDLLSYTFNHNISVNDILDLLVQRTHNTNWVVVFKSLITIHHLMCYGNERFTQNMASRTSQLNLSNFLDRKDSLGYDMSPFIRKYAKYISAKAGSYRSTGFDFCRAKRGKEEGKLRNMNAVDILMALPVLSDQLDSLLGFQSRASELKNGVINAAYMLLFKDCIRLFACYNEGIINLLEKYFDMNKKQCTEALGIYKKFLSQMEAVGEFLKVAEEVGIDNGEIPDLTSPSKNSAPGSLLDALEQHLAAMDNDKKLKKNPGVSTAHLSVNADAFSAASQLTGSKNPFFSEEVTDQEKSFALKEEQDIISDPFDAYQAKSENNPFASVESPPSSNSFSNVDLLTGDFGSPSTEDAFSPQPQAAFSNSPSAFPTPFANTNNSQSFNPFATSSQIFPQQPTQTTSPFFQQPTMSPVMGNNESDLFLIPELSPKRANEQFNPFADDSECTTLEPTPASATRTPPSTPNFNIDLDGEVTTAATGDGMPQYGVGMPMAPMSQYMVPQMQPAAPQFQPAMFENAFGNQSSQIKDVEPFNDLLQPTRPGTQAVSNPVTPKKAPQKEGLGTDLDSALANLSANLNIAPARRILRN